MIKQLFFSHLPIYFSIDLSVGGNKTPFNDRYEAFFIDYSLTPLLIQQNYIDSGDRDDVDVNVNGYDDHIDISCQSTSLA